MNNTLRAMRSPEPKSILDGAPGKCVTRLSTRLKDSKRTSRSVNSLHSVPTAKREFGEPEPTSENVAPKVVDKQIRPPIADQAVDMDVFGCNFTSSICGPYTPYCCSITLAQIEEFHALIGLYAAVCDLDVESRVRIMAAAKKQAPATIPDSMKWFQGAIDSAIEISLTKPLQSLATRCMKCQDRTMWLGLDIDPPKRNALKINPMSLPSDEDCRVVAGLDVIILFDGFVTKYNKLRRLCGSLYQANPRRLQVVDVDARKMAFLKLGNAC